MTLQAREASYDICLAITRLRCSDHFSCIVKSSGRIGRDEVQIRAPASCLLSIYKGMEKMSGVH